MTLAITFKPIGVWPKAPTTNRKRSPFKYRWNEVLKDLERELRHLGADHVEIQVDLDSRFIRNDGWPRSDARPRSPAVIVTFTAESLPGEPVQVYPCDTFAYWQDNIVAIARSLEKLRAVDRYGVTTAGQQYAGFKALPSGTAATMTSESAAEVVTAHGFYTTREVLTKPAIAMLAVRQARAATHPDRGGERTAWDSVEAARTVLSSHHGVSL